MKKTLVILASLLLVLGLAFATPTGAGDAGVKQHTVKQEVSTQEQLAAAFATTLFTKEIQECAKDEKCEYQELAVGYMTAVVGLLAQFMDDSVTITELIRESRAKEKTPKEK